MKIQMAKINSESRIKLNLKNVTELIGDGRDEWREGDFIIIETQTGTGKTHFVRMELIKSLSFDRILFLCNRKNLLRQVKCDLLAMRNEAIPSNEELDKIDTIGNTTIRSYQAVQAKILNDDYYKNPYTKEYEFYDYIIFDECHYILSDSRFNNTTRLIFEEYIQKSDLGTIKIFMTATACEIKKPILNYVESIKEKVKKIPYVSGGYRGEFEPKVYSSAIDYRYVNAKYFKRIENIITTIKNDTSDNKWIIFVSKIEDGENIMAELGKDTAVFIKSGSKHTELDTIIRDGKFERKVLIATKTLDNGISIKDDKVKHIVIMAWDKITFIQMLGRRRVDIENADLVNLYIPLRSGSSFHTRIYGDNGYAEKLENVKLCVENPVGFARKYDNDPNKINQELFYKHKETGQWSINPIGVWRIQEDKKFAEYMIQKFKDEGRFAFVKEQLSWIGLENTFDESNLIENVVSNAIINERESYLSSIYEKGSDGIMLMRANREELIEKINIRDGNGRLFKSAKTLNSALEELGSQFRIKSFETSRNGKSYKSAWRIIKQIPEEQ